MKLIFLVSLLASLVLVEGEHLVVGNVADRVLLVNHTLVEYNAFPFMKRVKYYFYTQTDNRKISGIQAIDNLHSKASMNITAGGVGYTYVNLRMKSERGRGLSYDIGIYVKDNNY